MISEWQSCKGQIAGSGFLKKMLGITSAALEKRERTGVIPAARRQPGMRSRWVLDDVFAAVAKHNDGGID